MKIIFLTYHQISSHKECKAQIRNIHYRDTGVVPDPGHPVSWGEAKKLILWTHPPAVSNTILMHLINLLKD